MVLLCNLHYSYDGYWFPGSYIILLSFPAGALFLKFDQKKKKKRPEGKR